jgi:hypothetical protein
MIGEQLVDRGSRLTQHGHSAPCVGGANRPGARTNGTDREPHVHFSYCGAPKELWSLSMMCSPHGENVPLMLRAELYQRRIVYPRKSRTNFTTRRISSRSLQHNEHQEGRVGCVCGNTSGMAAQDGTLQQFLARLKGGSNVLAPPAEDKRRQDVGGTPCTTQHRPHPPLPRFQYRAR